MPAPFYNAIKGTTAGTPGTGAFTPNAASIGFLAWSTVASGWIGLVRYEDGSAWELSYSYWNGTTLSRAATQFVSSSTASALTLTSAATAALIVDAGEVQPHLGVSSLRGWFGTPNSASASAFLFPAPTVNGTSGAATMASTNMLTEQMRQQITSATTANAHAGWTTFTNAVSRNTGAGRGGFECVSRFGVSQLPTGPRVRIGLTGGNAAAETAEPSAAASNFAFLGKDSTDTNLHLMVNSAAGAATKLDTGIPLVVNGWYEVTIWCEPGGAAVFILLIRLDTGAIFYGSLSSDLPASGSFLNPVALVSLSATTGTAAIFHPAAIVFRSGS